MALFMVTLHIWITFIFMLTLADANGDGWEVEVKQNIEVPSDSNVLILCKFTHPKTPTKNVRVVWKKDIKNGTGLTGDNNNPVIFDSKPAKIMEEYRGRTSLVNGGDPNNCSLQITKITHEENNLYVRVYVVETPYSFYKKTVSIRITADTTSKTVKDPPVSQVTENAFTSGTTSIYPISSAPPLALPSDLIISVVVPIGLIVGIVALIAFLIYRKRGRSRALNRSTSGYYANFSRRTENQTKRELSDLTRSFPQEQDVKAIEDEPVYNNLQSYQPSAASEMDESIYANV